MHIYRASELGSCTNRLVLAQVGFDAMDPPAKFQGYFARGDETEVEVKADLLAAGWKITREQEEVVVKITDDIIVRGHLDGVGVQPLDEFYMMPDRVLEIKRMNNAYWNVVKNGGWHVDGLMEKYRWQVSSYMLATGLECVLVCRNGDTGEDHYLYAEEPFHSFSEIAARVLVVEGRARTFSTLADLPPCDRKDYPCPFVYTHPEEDREELDGEEAEQFEAIGIAYAAAKERERIAKADASSLSNDVKRLLGERDKISAGRVRVTRFTGSRTNLDTDAMRNDGIDVAKYESKSMNKTPTVKITVQAGDE